MKTLLARCMYFSILLTLALFTSLLQAFPETATPESVGMDSEQLAKIKPMMQEHIDSNSIVGITTLVARHGKVVHFESVGALNMNTGEPLKSDALFRIYSMSKPIVSAAAMILFDEGKFNLDDPVENYLPAFKDTTVLVEGKEVPMDHPFTIRELISHNAGLTYGFFGDTPIDQQYREKSVLGQVNLEQMVAVLGDIPLQHQPGTKWHYSVSVDVLGRLIEVIAEQPLDEFLSARMFEPLGMEDTFFQVPADKVDRFGTNHRPGKEGIEIVDLPETSKYIGEVTLFSGGGGLVSTAMDYYRFNQMMLNMGELNGTRILKPDTVALMTRNHVNQGTASGSGESPQTTTSAIAKDFAFGLGYGITTREPEDFGSIGEYQWGGAAGTVFWNDPRENLTGILMIQMMGSQKPLRAQFKKAVYSAIKDDEG